MRVKNLSVCLVKLLLFKVVCTRYLAAGNAIQQFNPLFQSLAVLHVFLPVYHSDISKLVQAAQRQHLGEWWIGCGQPHTCVAVKLLDIHIMPLSARNSVKCLV